MSRRHVNVNKKEVKSIITTSKLPDSDFVVNPYIGCTHACIYCYACFMKKFTQHNNEKWGEFVDIKTNGPSLVPVNTVKYKNKSITVGSVTDPYQPIERKYRITENIIKRLICLEPKLFVMTKSDLVIRDINLFKRFKDCTVCVSLSLLDDCLRSKIEPFCSSIAKRLQTLKLLYDAEIKTVVFMAPILPYLTEWKKIIQTTKQYTTEYWFENLNMYSYVQNNIMQLLQSIDPDLVKKYKTVYSQKSLYWSNLKQDIQDYCTKNNIPYKIYWHHEAK